MKIAQKDQLQTMYISAVSLDANILSTDSNTR